MPAKKPMDHQPKDANKSYVFVAGGKTHRLPRISEDTAASIPGGIMQDAVMYPDDPMKQMALAFHMLNAAKPDAEASAALRSLSAKDMLEVVGEWMGESSGSSN